MSLSKESELYSSGNIQIYPTKKQNSLLTMKIWSAVTAATALCHQDRTLDTGVHEADVAIITGNTVMQN